MELIAAVMAAHTSDVRFDSARALLDYGLQTTRCMPLTPTSRSSPFPVRLGKTGEVQPVLEGSEKLLVEKSMIRSLEKTCVVAESVDAPEEKGQ
jgi:D-alanyl-D-alanine carboxypeptidase (penicillin-binding protein 5/6)